MSYSRSCGVSLAACGAIECLCDKSHVGALGGREKPVQRPVCGHCNDLCDYCGEIDGVCGRDFPCCTHDNALQTAHNQSREGA